MRGLMASLLSILDGRNGEALQTIRGLAVTGARQRLPAFAFPIVRKRYLSLKSGDRPHRFECVIVLERERGAEACVARAADEDGPTARRRP